VSGPLGHIRVLDLSRLLPGAFATALLGDLGAEVVKIEQPGTGDPMRGYEPLLGDSSAFHWVSDRNKRSVALNLRDPRGVEAVLRLAERCDVAIEGFRPGVADRLGIGYDALRAVNPALVYCSLSGFGAGGPLAAEAGHDINYVGRAGLVSVTGVEGRPAIPGTQLGDLGGALLGVAGLLAALVAAQQTGQGDHVDVALTDGAFALHSVALGPHFVTGHVPGAGTEMLTGGHPCYQLYTCADGRMLTVGALEPHFWRNLCVAVGRADLEPTHTDPTALPVWRALFATRTRDAWLELLAGTDTCTGPVNDLAEAVADPQLRHREMVIELEHPTEGVQRQLGTPIKLRERPGGVRTAAPALGADTRDVLVEAGYHPSEIEALLAAGVAAAADERTPHDDPAPAAR
jgi:crotonobetainyl-CoA:carnitine CoA-transferase CaiB-like acyl-CoA transferase